MLWSLLMLSFCLEPEGEEREREGGRFVILFSSERWKKSTLFKHLDHPGKPYYLVTQSDTVELEISITQREDRL